MKRFFVTALGLLAITASASAQLDPSDVNEIVIDASQLSARYVYQIGTPEYAEQLPDQRVASISLYSNVTTFLGSGIIQNAQISLLDDCTPMNYGGTPHLLDEFQFSVGNFGATAITNGRMRYRIWADNGSNAPSTTNIAAFSINLPSLAAGSATVFTVGTIGNPALLGNIAIPNSKMWVGGFFSTTANGNISNLGQLLFNPPTIGTSADILASGGTQAPPATSFPTSANLGGLQANLGLELHAPEPATLALLALGGLSMLRRRR